MLKYLDNFFVYIIRCKDGTFYTGYTNDLENRLKVHNSGKGAKYVRGKGPVQLVYCKKYRYFRSAIKHEAAIKRLTRTEKEELIGQDKNIIYR